MLERVDIKPLVLTSAARMLRHSATRPLRHTIHVGEAAAEAEVAVVATNNVAAIKEANPALTGAIKEEEAATTEVAAVVTVVDTTSRINNNRTKTSSSKSEVVVAAMTVVATKVAISPEVVIRAGLTPAMKAVVISNSSLTREVAVVAQAAITTSVVVTGRSTVHLQGSSSGSSQRASKLLRRRVLSEHTDSPNCEGLNLSLL